jgi:curved DNA-binding protein CbpA
MNIEQGLFKYNIRDNYAILGIPLGSNAQKIHKQYLKIARQLHPDTCKFKTPQERKLANQIFSQLVSPANSEISSEAKRLEYSLLLGQISQKVSEEDIDKDIRVSQVYQKLFTTGSNSLDLEYGAIISKLSDNIYQNIEEAKNKIALLSEINLVYLVQKNKLETQFKNQSFGVKQSETIKNTITEHLESNLTEKKMTGNIYLKRAEGYIERNLPDQAITELKDALKIDRNNPVAHALTGLAYLKLNQITMAKIHINKAIQTKSQEPIVLKAKTSLDNIIQITNPTGKELGKGDFDKKTTGNGILKNIFGGRKD